MSTKIITTHLREQTMTSVWSDCTDRQSYFFFLDVNGQSFALQPVKSGPHGTVLGPLLFLIFINDISQYLQLEICLFTADSILYRPVDLDNDHLNMQKRSWKASILVKDLASGLYCTRVPSWQSPIKDQVPSLLWLYHEWSLKWSQGLLQMNLLIYVSCQSDRTCFMISSSIM